MQHLTPPPSTLCCWFFFLNALSTQNHFPMFLTGIRRPTIFSPSALGINPCVHIHERTCGGQRSTSISTYISREVSHWTWHLPFCLDFLNNKPYGYRCLSITVPWVDRHVPPHLASLPGFWGSKLRPLCFYTSTLVTQPPPQPYSVCFLILPSRNFSGIHPWWIAC